MAHPLPAAHARRWQVLIAAPLGVTEQLAVALPAEVHIRSARTLEEALSVCEARPDLVVVCYAFDQVRPYRLLHRLRELGRPRMPVILVRALPVPLGTQESEIRDSYRALGVDEFINFSDEARDHGTTAALEHFRRAALNRLPYPGGRQ